MTHKILQTVEQQAIRPEKYWPGGPRTGKPRANLFFFFKQFCWTLLILLFFICRKILNDLSSEEVAHIEGKLNSPASTGMTGVTVPTTPIYQTSSGQYSRNISLPCLG